MLETRPHGAIVRLGGSSCVLTADERELRLVVTAGSTTDLEVLVRSLNDRLHVMGRRKALTTTWS